MYGQTRTGLIPTDSKLGLKKIILKKQHQVDVPQYIEGMPMPLSLKPLGGIYSPFAKTCSVLCNHPASANIKKIIHKSRQKVAIADKTIVGLPSKTIAGYRLSDDTANIISVDLLMRYSNTNSRPVTPTSTLTTLHTRLSKVSFSTNRRCITPELGKTDISTRKKLILDLRRSHSQETLYWKPLSVLSPNGLDEHGHDEHYEHNETKIPITSAKTYRKLPARPSKLLNKQKTKLTNNEEIIQHQRQKQREPSTQTCINERDDFDITDIRRGKKRKKIKAACAQISKTFYLNEDLETQVRAVKLDSLSPSNRGSLLTSALPKLQPEKDIYEKCEWSSNDTFLTEEAFKALALELDIEKIENHFETYLNLALQEAYKLKCSTFKSLNESKSCLESKLFGTKHNKIPRKFSKSATRFLVPMNLKSLEEMGVFTYLSTYVWISKQYKHIYMRVFHKYYELRSSEGDEQIKEDTIMVYKERRIYLKDLHDALENVLEFYGNENNIAKVLDLIDLNDGDINFRAWCGIVAFAERLTLTEIPSDDHCDELEIEDFTKMEMYLNDYQLPEKLNQMFNIIKITHTLNDNENQIINK